MILHLLPLSIFSTKVLKLILLPSFSFINGNFLKRTARKNTGAMTEMTKNAYEKKVATFLMGVVLLDSMIFMIAKKVKSK